MLSYSYVANASDVKRKTIQRTNTNKIANYCLSVIRDTKRECERI